MNFMKKRAIGAKDVTSIHAQDGRVILNCADGRQIQAFIPVKEFQKVLEPYGFISVNRGVLVNRDEIRHIERKAYHMKDGTVIEGRVRFLAEHRQMRDELRARKTYGEILVEGKYELYSVLDSLENAFALFEILPLEQSGNVRQFQLKYCNKAMEEQTSLTFQEMMEDTKDPATNRHGLDDGHGGGRHQRQNPLSARHDQKKRKRRQVHHPLFPAPGRLLRMCIPAGEK